jgi:hypothetical protein
MIFVILVMMLMMQQPMPNAHIVSLRGIAHIVLHEASVRDDFNPFTVAVRACFAVGNPQLVIYFDLL